ncbi:MAG TPA: dTMP kinase [Candidatus Dormibacteraeota bacterium]|nr:dTMP kinase [Candidatus Dormibacteraeota bacterium]
MFLVIEGIEGSGKSTLQARLAAQLRLRGSAVTTTREPGGSPLGEDIRALFLRPGLAVDPVAEAMLVNAARAQHVATVIRPALERGELVLCDRFTDSTLAYQGYGRGLNLTMLAGLCEAATQGLAPTLTILLDCTLRLSQERLGSRGLAADRLEAEGEAFHARVREGFLALARASERHLVLDAGDAPERLGELALARIEGLTASA